MSKFRVKSVTFGPATPWPGLSRLPTSSFSKRALLQDVDARNKSGQGAFGEASDVQICSTPQRKQRISVKR
jgi:hypothetical protein